MKKNTGFYPNQIIFASNDSCNLHCSHCFVSRNNLSLNIDDAKKFLLTCKNSQIERVGFSGGEPFLYFDFLEELCKFSVENDFCFDRIMTNADWWTDIQDLHSKLLRLYEAGFDGKFGISFDAFHGQNVQRMVSFCEEVFRIWSNPSCIEIQSVVCDSKSDLLLIESFANKLCLSMEYNLDKSNYGLILLSNDSYFIPIYRTPLSYKFNDERMWKSKKWFKDDFCKSTGNILYVHSSGDISHCCGFANERKELIIGNIKQSLDEVLTNAKKNELVDICYNRGLKQQIKKLKKKGIKIPGKTKDICGFCDFFCENFS